MAKWKGGKRPKTSQELDTPQPLRFSQVSTGALRTYPSFGPSHTLVSHRIIASQDTREKDALTQVTQVTQATPHSTQLALLVMHVHVHRTSAIATVRTQSHSVEPLVTPPTTHLLAHRSTSYIPCVFLPSAVVPARGDPSLKGSAMNAPPPCTRLLQHTTRILVDSCRPPVHRSPRRHRAPRWSAQISRRRRSSARPPRSPHQSVPAWSRAPPGC